MAPVLVLAEVAGAVARHGDDSALGQEAMRHLQVWCSVLIVASFRLFAIMVVLQVGPAGCSIIGEQAQSLLIWAARLRRVR